MATSDEQGMTYSIQWLSIANRALVKTGNQQIENFTGGTDNVKIINALLPEALESVIALYPWRCLKKRVELAPSATSPAFGYTYSYPLPNNFGKLVEVYTDDSLEWVREAGAILTDSTTCEIVYIELPELPTNLTPLLRELITIRLAYNLSQTTTSNTTLMNTLSEEFNSILLLAEREDTQAESDTTEWEGWNNYR